MCVNAPGGGGFMPPALCINLNLLVCFSCVFLVAKAEFSPRSWRYMQRGGDAALLG